MRLISCYRVFLFGGKFPLDIHVKKEYNVKKPIKPHNERITKMANITLDENGKISDNDELYKVLDECYDNDEFDNIIAAVLSVPEEQRSVKLRFRLIGALNNNEDFETAKSELEKILPDCKTPAEISEFFYRQGYICFIKDKELAALSFYEAGVNADPENTSGLDLAAEVKECREYVDKDLKALGELTKQVCDDIDKRCAETKEKEKLSDGAFTVLMGLIPALRQLPALDRGLGLDDFFRSTRESRRRSSRSGWTSCSASRTGTALSSFIRALPGAI